MGSILRYTAMVATVTVVAAGPPMTTGHSGSMAIGLDMPWAQAQETGAESGHPRDGSVAVERRAHLMGTVLGIRVEAPTRKDGIRATEDGFRAVREMDALLSTWRPDSELSVLNRSPVGAPISLSSDLGPLLEEVWRWSEETAGVLRPQIGALVDAWGLRTGGSLPSPAELERARQASSLDAFTVVGDGARTEGGVEGPAIVRTDPRAWIDAGAFGKGAALRAAALRLQKSGVASAVLDFGGQLLLMGSEARPVRVAHPEHRERSVGSLMIADGSVATAGASERRWTVEGRIVTHIVDPATGLPVEPWGSVTVVADDPLVADLVSTALFAMGPERAVEWAAGRDDVGVLVLEKTERSADHRFELLGGAPGLAAAWNQAMEPYIQSSEHSDLGTTGPDGGSPAGDERRN